MNIVLHQPEIPANTGNIGRTCVATGTSLHLIEPLGFSLSEKALKRAGMDYWKDLDVHTYVNFDEFLEKHPGAKIWMATTKAKHVYSDVTFGPDDFIMFGKESAGIPEEILVEHEETCIRIPMEPAIRSLNLSNSVAIVLYEALRQQNFESMQLEGELHRLHWKATEATDMCFSILKCRYLVGLNIARYNIKHGTENTNALRLDEVFSVPMLYLAILTPTQSGTKRLRITYLSGPWRPSLLRRLLLRGRGRR